MRSQHPPNLPSDGVLFDQEEARARPELSRIRGGEGRHQNPGRVGQAPGAPPSEGRRLKTILAAVLAAVVVLVAGCAAEGGESTTERGERSVKEESSRQSSDPQAENEDEPPQTEDDVGGFVTSAESSGGTGGAADRIEGVRFQIFEDYERLLIDFGRDGRTAGVPRWSVEHPQEGGYIRLRFPGVASTEVTHEDFVGSVLDEFYVVRGRSGGLFADVFAMHAFRYRVTELPESGRLAIDFRGALEEIEFPPTTGDKVVVLQPREAEEIGGPIEVRGYARLFEGQVTVSLLDREREVIFSETVRANDWTTAWGLFQTTLEVQDYEGFATLRVGSRSPRDGSFVGTETEVFLE